MFDLYTDKINWRLHSIFPNKQLQIPKTLVHVEERLGWRD